MQRDDGTIVNIPVIIHPLVKRALADPERGRADLDGCRAALFGQLLYQIAWKLKTAPLDCNGQVDTEYVIWFGTLDHIENALLDYTWCLSKIRKELKRLVEDNVIGQRRNPAKKWDQTRQYFFGPEQAQTFLKLCQRAEVCVQHLGFGPDILNLFRVVGILTKDTKCICEKQQMHLVKTTNEHSVNLTNASVTNNGAIPKNPITKNPSQNPTENPTYSEKPTYESASSSGVSTPDHVQDSPSGVEKNITEATPVKPVEPPLDARWTAETMVQWFEWKHGRCYKDKRREAELRAATKLLHEAKTTREELDRVYTKRNDAWWRDNRGLLHASDLAAKTTRGIMRYIEVRDQLYYLNSNQEPQKPPTPPKGRQVAPSYSQKNYTEGEIARRQREEFMRKQAEKVATNREKEVVVA
jgi:hypothetical protein